jgi:hypothetical protein
VYYAACHACKTTRNKQDVKNRNTIWPSLNPQDVLPFPPTPSASIAGRTLQESVYKRRAGHAGGVLTRRIF